MTTSEFEKWIDLFAGAFPDVGEWLRKAGSATVEAWRGVLVGLEYQDTATAVHRILDGTEPFPSPWSAFPSVIRRIAMKEGYQRRKQAELVNRKPEPAIRGTHNTGTMGLYILDCLKSGMSKDEALLMLNKKFPI